MLKRHLISVAALCVFGVFAAGSTSDIISQARQASGSADNVAACKRYVSHYNGLSCIKKVGVHLDQSKMCPDALDMNPNDMSPYYDCMVAGSKCNGNVPDLEASTKCSP